MTTAIRINDLQAAHDALADERADAREKANDDPHDAAGREATRRVAELTTKLAAADAKISEYYKSLPVDELLLERGRLERERAALLVALPGLRFAADAEPMTSGPALRTARRRYEEVGFLIGGIDRIIAAQRVEQAEELAQAWFRDAALQRFVEGEAVALDHVAALAIAYDAARQAGAAATSMHALPQSSIGRLRELRALVLALANRGARIDTKSLPASVRAYLEGQ